MIGNNILTRKKPSFEVSPTAFQLVLLIYSLQFRSAFAPHCRIWFHQLYSLSAEKGTGTFSPVTLNQAMTLTYDLDQDMVK